MRKPTDSSGIDNMTAKSQSLQRSLHQIEEFDTFGDEMDEDEVSEEGSETSVSDSDSDSEDSDKDILGPDEDNTAMMSHAEVVDKMKNVVVPSPHASSVTKVTIPASDTKSKNAKPNLKTHLNVGKCLYL